MGRAKEPDQDPQTVHAHLDSLVQFGEQALGAGNLRMAQRLLDRLSRQAASSIDPAIRLRHHRLGFHLAQRQEDETAMLSAALAAVDCCPPGSDEELRWHHTLANLHIDYLSLNQAKGHLAHLEAAADRCVQLGLSPVRVRAVYDITAGNAAAIIERLGGGPHPGISEASRLHVVALADLICGNLEAAERRITASGNLLASDPSTMHSVALLEFFLLLTRRDYGKAEEALRRQAAGNQGRLSRHFLHGAINLALCQRQPTQAHDLLVRLDPDRCRRNLAMEWTRLHLLRGDLSAAARSFIPLLPDGVHALLEGQLFWAHEITPATLARLWHATSGGPAPNPPMAGTLRPAPASEDRVVLVGASAAMGELRRRIALVAQAAQPVLITGETGTGKEIVARLLHRDGPCRDRPFIALNAAGMPDTLAEAELFGHAKGAFTGAIGANEGLIRGAGEGVLFIDEVNSMPLRIQGLLLRVLETGEFRPVGSMATRTSRCRFIFASNVDLTAAVAAGSFRQDLLFRINRLTIEVPPLRSRMEDIPALSSCFLARTAPVDTPTIEPVLLDRFRAYAWPGNVRELRNEIERLVLLRAGRQTLGLADADVLSPSLREALASGTPSTREPQPMVGPVPGHPDPRIPGEPEARARRARILGLLTRIPRLYRSDVIRQIGCSPDTATRDMRALLDAGLVRRVLTSGHLRTSYFVHPDSPE
ncbi:MAG: Transcriptional regulatory protein ZraR [Planctomycetota bacterium]|jgi:DNA-binding NtrC family response regulator